MGKKANFAICWSAMMMKPNVKLDSHFIGKSNDRSAANREEKSSHKVEKPNKSMGNAWCLWIVTTTPHTHKHIEFYCLLSLNEQTHIESEHKHYAHILCIYLYTSAKMRKLHKQMDINKQTKNE